MAVDEAALRAEQFIDAAVAAHPLLTRPYPEAIFHAIAAAELIGVGGVNVGSKQDTAISLNVLVNVLRFAVDWIARGTAKGDDNFAQSLPVLLQGEDLVLKARQYENIFSAYAFARRNVIELSAAENRLIPTHQLTDDARYEAYNLLLKPSIEPETSPNQPDDATTKEVKKCFSRGIVMGAIPSARNVLAPATHRMSLASLFAYSLPPSWSFGDFTLAQFHAINDVLRGLIYAWRMASQMAASMDSSYKAFLPLAIRRKEVLAAIRDLTALPKATVSSVLRLLEYGSSGINAPDPALQPLLPFTDTTYLLSTALVVGSSPERNLITLLNMIPATRALYDTLKNEKEALMRERIIGRTRKPLTHWFGRVPGKPQLGDVDLALVDEAHRTLLLLELKWFIDPAEIREVLQRTEDLAKGVRQSKSRLREARENPSTFAFLFGGDVPLRVDAAVISANWIGMADAQDPEIAVINEEHFSRKLESSRDLASLGVWLASRAYLPQRDVHFRVREVDVEFFGWQMPWYGLEALEKGAFLPL
jgi:hypothetical protein